MSLSPLDRMDLEHVLAHAPIWEALRDRRVLITGGTGFFGVWLVESLAHASRALGLGARALVVTRDPAAFLARAPHLAGDPALELLAGDLRDCAFPAGELAGVIHAAVAGRSPAGARQVSSDAELEATRRTLELARERGARYLFTSSGAVYGRQPPERELLDEECPWTALPPGAEYAQAKRRSELLCARHAAEHGVAATIARGFAFVGPGLPLDRGFAIGSFLRDALAGGPVRVQGDGTPLRSYLYAADLAIWLWTIWGRGLPGRAYNVGSEQAISIRELAELIVAELAPGSAVELVGRAGAPAAEAPERYLPSTRRAREELGLRERVPLRDAIARTAAWHRDPGRAPSP